MGKTNIIAHAMVTSCCHQGLFIEVAVSSIVPALASLPKLQSKQCPLPVASLEDDGDWEEREAERNGDDGWVDNEFPCAHFTTSIPVAASPMSATGCPTGLLLLS
jgi:hypothetical protein